MAAVIATLLLGLITRMRLPTGYPSIRSARRSEFGPLQWPAKLRWLSSADAMLALICTIHLYKCDSEFLDLAFPALLVDRPRGNEPGQGAIGQSSANR